MYEWHNTPVNLQCEIALQVFAPNSKTVNALTRRKSALCYHVTHAKLSRHCIATQMSDKSVSVTLALHICTES